MQCSWGGGESSLQAATLPLLARLAHGTGALRDPSQTSGAPASSMGLPWQTAWRQKLCRQVRDGGLVAPAQDEALGRSIESMDRHSAREVTLE